MSPRLAARRRRLRLPALALAVALAALAVPASASATGLDEAGYWPLADATQQRLDPTWDERAGMYRPGGSGTDPAVNASLLLTHAVAAQRGHEGPARNDHRARLIAARLTGLVVDDLRGRRLLATQHPRHLSERTPPLRLTHAPSGVGASAAHSTAGRAYAGPFRALTATGTTAAGSLSARVTHRFTGTSVTTAWTLRSGRRGVTARVMFPTYGPGSHVEAVLRNGRRVTVGAAPVALARVSRFLLHSARSGYEVVPVGRPPGAVVSSVQVASQSAAPRAGRSLVIRIARGRIAGARFAARLRVRPGLAVR